MRALLEPAHLTFRPTRRDIDPESGEATAQALSDRHQWESGDCWLWCGQLDIDVTWLGPVQSSGMHADLYGCRGCLYRLDQLVLRATLANDKAALAKASGPAELPTALAGAGRHRRASASRRWRTRARTDR